jgi:hypothetical protein
VSICLLDTSILCEVLEVPNRCQSPAAIEKELRRKIQAAERLLLPMISILETGNHIGQNGDGRQRRETAERFIRFVEDALAGKAPFTPTPFFEPENLSAWLQEFPDWAMRGSGFGDLTIIQDFHRQCLLNRKRRVYIWSLDEHLSSYDRQP